MARKETILSDCRIIGEVCSWKWLQNEDASWQDETSFTVKRMRGFFLMILKTVKWVKSTGYAVHVTVS